MLKEFIISTNKKNEVIDINSEVESILKESKAKSGICTVFTPHATAAIIINENYDPNIGDDFLDALNELIKEGKWRHDKVDGNAASHIKASIVGPSETIPVENGKLMLGRWQDIMLCEFDGPRKRTVYVKPLRRAPRFLKAISYFEHPKHKKTLYHT